MEVVLILGYNSEKKGNAYRPTETLKRRLDEGLRVYNSIDVKKHRIVIVSGGSTTQIIGDEGELVNTEFNTLFSVMKDYLSEKGISERKIFVDLAARETIDNCLNGLRIMKRLEGDWRLSKFSSFRPSYGETEAVPYLESRDVQRFANFDLSIEKLHIVTSRFHLERAKRIFSYFRCETEYECVYYGSTAPAGIEKLHAVIESRLDVGKMLEKYPRDAGGNRPSVVSGDERSKKGRKRTASVSELGKANRKPSKKQRVTKD